MIRLKSVVIKVVKETRSGSASNWSANNVVLTAVGIADWTIKTLRSKSLIGIKNRMTVAKRGERTIRVTVIMPTER